jgi:hypothetical protein
VSEEEEVEAMKVEGEGEEGRVEEVKEELPKKKRKVGGSAAAAAAAAALLAPCLLKGKTG